ncbi:SpoIIE family protein phosphatase [Amycolatopsis sp. PS_44_ISF1]|uniref:SpoIIE family protein phosphatase n=1 Tax=Amycolatopsis sp. PS_44_ISF1 TaxID=2974917 RepID=UPI0028DDD7F5|nr:SpoIIE family protein phosphatase [Amycolatopsis sp. PS_44_ISF1]MDT8912278.1 SpoIIE family protein phosphatase [Amycolatopsis sp. PS_44_ISF1]
MTDDGSALHDPARRQALRDLGLGARPDEQLDRLARHVTDRLGVPVALVSLVESDRQVFPGLCGLAAPWGERRATPLTHSLCARAVGSARPVVVGDTRGDVTVPAPVITEMNIIAYAGIPLTDDTGRVLGTLCAIDHQPRAWSEHELSELAELAAQGTTLLRLRLALHTASRERARSDELNSRLHAALDRVQLLLTAAEALSTCNSVTDLRHRIADLVASGLKPSRVELLITENLGPRATTEDQGGGAAEDERAGQWAEFDPDADLLTSQVVREARLICHPDLHTAPDALSPGARGFYLGHGVTGVIAAPIHGPTGVLGVLEFGWAEPHSPDLAELAVVTGLAGYVATALQRVRLLQNRITSAHELQQAMLPDLSELPGLTFTSHYHAAAHLDQVGGDWYDAFALPAQLPGGTVAVVIGDVTGHDIHAAAKMGQLRSMLRQACWDQQPHGSPAGAFTAVDDALGTFGDATAGGRITGTAFLAYLTPLDDGSRRWRMTWTSAGHPPGIVVHPDKTTTLLEESGPLLGYSEAFPDDRRDHQHLLDTGSTVVLYTDGLIERRGIGFDDAITLLAAHAATQPPRRIARTALHAFGDGTEPSDDIAILTTHLTQDLPPSR